MTPIVLSAVWDDLRGVLDRIAPDNPEAALRVVGAAEKSFELIAKNPGIGRTRCFAKLSLRSWPIREFPNYLVFYILRRDEVHILAVLHGAMELDRVITERLRENG
jgi:toxin ParE1/3/4